MRGQQVDENRNKVEGKNLAERMRESELQKIITDSVYQIRKIKILTVNRSKEEKTNFRQIKTK